ncbi:hypothetical protein [Shewanella algae]|uniref:hypothetical protein n=1 Tax=Shewanella algae TaxID=38313 RepID=UPI0031F482BC
MCKNECKIISSILLLCIFFPFLGVIQGIDIQPNFLIVGSVFLPLFVFVNRLSLKVITIYVFMLYLIFLHYFIFYDLLSLKYFITYVGTFLTAFLMYVYFNANTLNISKSGILTLIFIYLFIGMLQKVYPTFLLELVSRSAEAGESLSETGRGVRSITVEPAALGKIITTFNLLYLSIYLRQYDYSKFYAIFFSFILLVFNALIPMSLYALAIHCVSFIILVFILDKRYVFLIFFIFVSVFVVLYFNYEYIEDYRIIRLVVAVFNSPDFILQQGAIRRLFNIPISVNNLYYYGWLGSSNSSEMFLTSFYTPIGYFYYEMASKANGGFVELILRFGILSIPFLFFYAYVLSKITSYKILNQNGREIRIGVYYAATVFLLTFQDSSTVSPVAWFLVFHFYFISKKNNVRASYL